jgi:hypothetical protein
MGLLECFLIHIKDESCSKFLFRLAVDGDRITAGERRRRGCTRVHSLATMACSTKVVGASTGILTPDNLPMEVWGESRFGDDDGEVASQGLRRIDSHSRAIERDATFFRHCLRFRDSFEEERERFDEGEIGDGTREDVPWGDLAAGGEATTSPARSVAGDGVAQNHPGRRSNGSIRSRFVAASTFTAPARNMKNHLLRMSETISTPSWARRPCPRKIFYCT